MMLHIRADPVVGIKQKEHLDSSQPHHHGNVFHWTTATYYCLSLNTGDNGPAPMGRYNVEAEYYK